LDQDAWTDLGGTRSGRRGFPFGSRFPAGSLKPTPVCVGSCRIFPELNHRPSMAWGNGRSAVTVLEVAVPACSGLVVPGGLGGRFGASMFLVCLRRKSFFFLSIIFFDLKNLTLIFVTPIIIHNFSYNPIIYNYFLS